MSMTSPSLVRRSGRNQGAPPPGCRRIWRSAWRKLAHSDRRRSSGVSRTFSSRWWPSSCGTRSMQPSSSGVSGHAAHRQ
eukprot:2416111-Prymnesium_polylepis.1